MKTILAIVIMSIMLLSCENKAVSNKPKALLPLIGTWKLISGTTIEGSGTTVTDYTKDASFIKIINETHFAFLKHDVTGKKDPAAFSAGGGPYTLIDSLYTERLEYCSDPAWEANDFSFTISIKEDTLIQRGVEKVESAGIDRINIEKYSRVKN
jgi:hypothetical protein